MRNGGVQSSDFYFSKGLQYKIVISGNNPQLVIILANSLFANEICVIKNVWIVEELGFDIADLKSI
jgi:fructose-specific component phosphotransferase system IIB-like protein